MQASCIYIGHVRHRRFAPVNNAFRYRIYMMYLDLAELPELFAGRWLWSVNRANFMAFHREDYFGPKDVSLDTAIRDAVSEKTGQRPAGPVRMLTHVRCCGHIFNPVSIYYCFDATDSRVETVVTQITNTPWRQRHAYILAEDRNQANPPRKRYTFEKVFHVSPYNPMALHYDWRFSHPDTTLNVHMMCSREEQKVFDATLTLTRREITPVSLSLVLLTYPFMTWKVTGMIYWQALRLWAKRAPYYDNPVSEHGVQSQS